MDDDRRTLTDSALEREIEAALAVDPSPEFLARVRQRVAREPVPARWRLGWELVTAGAVTAALVIVVAVFRSSDTTRPAPTVQASIPGKPIANAVPAVAPTITRRVPVIGTTRPLMEKVNTPIPRTAPEVLISTEEAAALRRLLAGVREGRVDLSRWAAVPPAPTALEPIERIAIERVTIEPLVRSAREEGVRQ